MKEILLKYEICQKYRFEARQCSDKLGVDADEGLAVKISFWDFQIVRLFECQIVKMSDCHIVRSPDCQNVRLLDLYLRNWQLLSAEREGGQMWR